MNKKTNTETMALHRTLQWVVVVFSIFFFYVLANGYYNLIVYKSEFLAVVFGVILASLAWGLAKFIGSSISGIKGHFPMFVCLLIISALGVFNWLI
jgi:uncharacterized oligopeptide transporter (OPT) family protein